MTFNFSFKLLLADGEKLLCQCSLYKTYRVTTNIPVDVVWHRLINLADMSWHPLFVKTRLPKGLIPKPGLIFGVVTRLTPIPIRVFVENVRPKEFLSIRLLAIPGIEQRITYQMESTLRGSYIAYSITLKGWLSPLIWWFIKPYSAKVASELVNAAAKSLP
ncbi:MAG: SRPBCC family protein [Cyanobacterium sp.]